ncbi:DUF7002 family protein [Roseicyclus marinus]|uniref:DUF7002 family protein n=1 Tax=Roseicyclus marinus TaxID=2161673 RepID=UPI00240F8BDB|nr:hypothetical protein [Roseicyclus marinus]MDG3040347.1 hypothetical protein [Roseicyclus marinus]
MRDHAIAQFRRAAGPRVAHVTAAENLPGILARGLWPAADLARENGVAEEALALRDHRMVIGQGPRRARLNHQKPILHGRNAANRIVEGHDAESWAMALDRRVFLWPARRGKDFKDSIGRDLPLAVLWLDTDALAKALFDAIDLAPINTGNFTQGGAHARRGDWIYVPLSQGIDAFRDNRRRRLGLRKRDTLAEISLRQGIPADLLSQLIVDQDT